MVLATLGCMAAMLECIYMSACQLAYVMYIMDSNKVSECLYVSASKA